SGHGGAVVLLNRLAVVRARDDVVVDAGRQRVVAGDAELPLPELAGARSGLRDVQVDLLLTSAGRVRVVGDPVHGDVVAGVKVDQVGLAEQVGLGDVGRDRVDPADGASGGRAGGAGHGVDRER